MRRDYQTSILALEAGRPLPAVQQRSRPFKCRTASDGGVYVPGTISRKAKAMVPEGKQRNGKRRRRSR